MVGDTVSEPRKGLPSRKRKRKELEETDITATTLPRRFRSASESTRKRLNAIEKPQPCSPRDTLLFREKTPCSRHKRRDHPFQFACWLLHIALVWCIGGMLFYTIYTVVTSKHQEKDQGKPHLATPRPSVVHSCPVHLGMFLPRCQSLSVASD